MSPPREPISPELALVDPELLARARRELTLRHEATDRPSPVAATDETSLPSRLGSRPVPRRPAAPVPDTLAAGVPRTSARVRAPDASASSASHDQRRQRRRWRTCVRFALTAGPFVAVALAIAWAELGPRPLARVVRFTESPPVVHQPRHPTRPVDARKAPRTVRATTDTPRRGARRGRTFGWVPARGSSFYEVRLFRRDLEIFAARTTVPRLVLPPAWRYKGRVRRLTPGRYRWLVLPGFGPRSRPRYGAAVVSARLVVGR